MTESYGHLENDLHEFSGAAERAAVGLTTAPARLSCRSRDTTKRQVGGGPGSADRKSDSLGLLTKPRRRAMGDDLVLYVARRLTGRDRAILDLLAEHRVLTSEHIADAFFGSATTARHRLTQLHAMRLVQRFAPFVERGSAPYHYVLDQLGAAVVAAERGEEIKRFWRQDRALVLSRSQRLAHLVGVNGFFTSLMGEARRQADARLGLWWSEPRCARWCEGLVKPDGYGEWHEGGRSVGFFLEYDRHTETRERLAAKLVGYARLADAMERCMPVLFVFRSQRREASARSSLAGSRVPVATTTERGPGWPVRGWLADGDTARVDLVTLASRRAGSFRAFVNTGSERPAWWYRENGPGRTV